MHFLKALLAAAICVVTVVADANDLDGVWLVEIKMQSNSARSTFTLDQEGETISGRYVGQFGEAAVTGTKKGDSISFSYFTETQGVPVEVTYIGALEGEVMHGTVRIVGFADGTFRGTRHNKP